LRDTKGVRFDRARDHPRRLSSHPPQALYPPHAPEIGMPQDPREFLAPQTLESARFATPRANAEPPPTPTRKVIGDDVKEAYLNLNPLQKEELWAGQAGLYLAEKTNQVVFVNKTALSKAKLFPREIHFTAQIAEKSFQLMTPEQRRDEIRRADDLVRTFGDTLGEESLQKTRRLAGSPLQLYPPEQSRPVAGKVIAATDDIILFMDKSKTANYVLAAHFDKPPTSLRPGDEIAIGFDTGKAVVQSHRRAAAPEAREALRVDDSAAARDAWTNREATIASGAKRPQAKGPVFTAA
jgi:hypothetical protein